MQTATRENAKWLPQSGKLTSGYEMANKGKEKTTTLSENKEEASNVS